MAATTGFLLVQKLWSMEAVTRELKCLEFEVFVINTELFKHCLAFLISFSMHRTNLYIDEVLYQSFSYCTKKLHT